jgi:hypothetical protein
MEGMFAIVPDPMVPGSVVVGGGHDDGVEAEVSVSVPTGDEQAPFTLRTLLRTGTRIHPSGVVMGTATDAVSIAGMAATGLLLQTLPTGLSRSEAKDHHAAVVAQADTLARDHERWSFRAVDLGGTSYALRFRILGQGFIAHADLGDCVVAAWGTGALPDALRRVQKLESGSLSRPE